MRTAIGITIIALALYGAAQADIEKGLVAHWDFDEGKGTVLHDRSGNKNHGKIHGATFVKSPRGHALRFDPKKKSYVDCGRKPILNVAGDLTVEVWLKASPDARGDKFIFGDTSSYAVKRNFYISSFEHRLRMEHGNGTVVEQLVSDREVFDGTWQHVAMICEYPYYYMYLNGRQVMMGKMTLPITPTAITPRHIGGWWTERGYFKGEIDDIRVYNRALPERMIVEHAGKERAAARPQIKLMPTLYYISQGLDVRLLCKNTMPGTQEVNLAILEKSGKPISQRKEPVRETRPGSERGILETSFDVKGLTPGEYLIRATIMDKEGKVPMVSEEKPFTYPEKPDWYGSQAGISDQVLPPYTDIKVVRGKERIAVQTWGRQHYFGNTPFLAGIESRGKALLAGPMRLTGRMNGQPLRLNAGRSRVVQKTAAKTLLSQEFTGRPLTVSTRMAVEYDGFVKIDWELKVRNPATLEKLTLEIPLDATVARYVYQWPVIQNGALTRSVNNYPFRAMLWLGDEERGLAWVAESDRHWLPDSPNRAIQILKGPREVTLRFNIVEKPFKLEPAKPLTYTFAMQATPVKPVLKDNWDYRFHHISQTTHGPAEMILKVPDSILDTLAAKGVKTVCFHEHWTPCHSYTRTTHEADLESFVRRCHQRGMKVLLYFGFYISDLIPEWPYIGEECICYPKRVHLSNYPPAPIQNLYLVCLNSVYQDLLVDGVARVMDRFDIDGVYLDSTVIPFACSSSLHGCGFRKPDGSVASTYPILAIRETLKRIYTVIKQRKTDGLVDVHVYDAMNIPALSWATSYWNGEQLRRAKFYADGLPLDRFRTECMGRNWGVSAEFLHYGLGGYREGYSLSLLHDVLVRAAGLGANLDLESSLWKLMDDFGRKEARWYPYWNNAEYLKVTPAGCHASFYHHPKNGVLLVVSNLSRKEGNVRLDLDLARLGLKGPFSARDALSGSAVGVEDAAISLTLPSVGWKVIWVKGGGAKRRKE